MSRPVRLDEPLSFRDAARAIGWPHTVPSARRLRRLVLAREKRSGKLIAIRLAGERHPKLRISIALLKLHFRDLVPDRTEALAREVRAAMDGLREELRELVREVVDRELAAEVRRAVATELARRKGL